VALELTTVSDDSAVLHDGTRVVRREGLQPATGHVVEGLNFTTLARPPGARLALVATVNDVHFGEVECGHLTGLNLGPILRSAPGDPPYPVMMNAAAAGEIAALSPDLVVAKGDITSAGRRDEYELFEACYRPVFGDRLVVTRGNHDHPAHGPAFDCPPALEMHVPGAVVAVLDTSAPGVGGGRLSPDQLEWLDELGARATQPVLVFGHHPCWEEGAEDWVDRSSAIDEPGSTRLVEVVARRPAIVGYFAGHTHRNRVRRFPATGNVPFAEVASTKDFPGSWAEYRVFEGGVLQIVNRISTPEALRWSEECRHLFAGLYPRYAMGRLQDRCLRVC
jgi:Icc protein